MDADPRKERWIDAAAGPIVRPYAMTRGRTAPRGLRLDLITMLAATGRSPGEQMRVSPEQRRLLAGARRPATVADLASELDLPLGVVRVLLGDLIQQGLLAIHQPAVPYIDPLDPLRRPDTPRADPLGPDPLGVPPARPDRRLLTRVLNDLRSL